MIKGRSMDHIGMAVCDVEASKNWYCEVMGFRVIAAFDCGMAHPVYFLQNGTTIYEMYQKDDIKEEVKGKIDHIAYVSNDIQSDYEYCVKQGYKIVTNGVEEIPSFWNNGVKLFFIESPTGEKVEFIQIL